MTSVSSQTEQPDCVGEQCVGRFYAQVNSNVEFGTHWKHVSREAMRGKRAKFDSKLTPLRRLLYRRLDDFFSRESIDVAPMMELEEMGESGMIGEEGDSKD